MKLKLIENIDWNRLKVSGSPPPPPPPKSAQPTSAPVQTGTYSELGDLAKRLAELKKAGIHLNLKDLLQPKPEKPKDPNGPEAQAKRKIKQRMAEIQHNYTKGMRAAGW